MERQDLFTLLGDAMRGQSPDEAFGGTLRTSSIKSRMLEAHPAESSEDGAGALLAELGTAAGFSVETIGDELWVMQGPRDSLFVDTLNPRFWLLHSASTSASVRSIVQRALVADPRLDRAWLSAHHLNEMEGERRWIRSSFRSDELRSGEDDESGIPRRWRIQIEGEDPDELLRLVRQEERYRASASLTAVGSRFREPGVGHAEVAADYQGGFVSSGSNFELVVGMLWRSLDRYEAYIRGLEAEYRLGTTVADNNGSDGSGPVGLTIDGDVAFLEFPHQIRDLEAFLAGLFNCREPFRLWALPRSVGNDQWEANVVDLHVGHALRMEITPEWMRVLLDETTCGNTLARLVANLQHRFDARMSIPLAA